MPKLADPVRGGLERVGVRLHASQIREVREIGDAKGEDFSTALRLVVRLGIEQFRLLSPEERAVS